MPPSLRRARRLPERGSVHGPGAMSYDKYSIGMRFRFSKTLTRGSFSCGQRCTRSGARRCDPLRGRAALKTPRHPIFSKPSFLGPSKFKFKIELFVRGPCTRQRRAQRYSLLAGNKASHSLERPPTVRLAHRVPESLRLEYTTTNTKRWPTRADRARRDGETAVNRARRSLTYAIWQPSLRHGARI